MVELSLYQICLQRISFLLTSGTLNSNSHSFFSSFPSEVIYSLISFMLRPASPDGNFNLQFHVTSGVLTHLNLSHIRFRESFATSIKLLSNLCISLQCLRLTEISVIDKGSIISDLLTSLLKLCTNLKDLISCLPFDLKALRNCKKLSSLQLGFKPGLPLHDFLERKDGHVQTLPSLKLFTIYDDRFTSNSSSRTYELRLLLKHCPELTSMGSIETALPLAHLNHQLKMEGDNRSPNCKLQKCFWICNKLPYGIMKSSNVIEKAVLACPLVEELEIATGYFPDLLRDLIHLRKLTSLKITFSNLPSDCLNNFYFVINHIGDQLKHLTLQSGTSHKLLAAEVDAICKTCPNLESLRLLCPLTVKDCGALANFQYLEKLQIGSHEVDSYVVLYLLSKCINLKEIILIDITCLNDELLFEVLRCNPLSKLKEAEIYECSLSSKGIEKFVECAQTLERVNITSTILPYHEVKSLLKKSNQDFNILNGYHTFMNML